MLKIPTAFSRGYDLSPLRGCSVRHLEESMKVDTTHSVATASRGPLAWIADLQPRERRAFGACVGGWALDAMDVQMYSFVIPALIATWGITRGQAGVLGTAALLVSAVGGLLAGWLADRIGRVRTLQLAILWFSVFTFLSGLAQNYEQLFVARALLGLGFGGEWAAGAVLLGESIRAEHRGKALGVMQSGWAVGWGIATILNFVFFSIMPVETAWRALFLVGILPAIFVFFVRRYVEEPPIYLETRAQMAAKGDRASVIEIFKPPLLRITVLGGLMGTGAQGGYAAVMTWLPTFLRTERGLSILDSTGYLAVLITGAFCGYLTGGIPRRPHWTAASVPGVCNRRRHCRGDVHGHLVRQRYDVDSGLSARIFSRPESSAPWAPFTRNSFPREFAASARASPTISAAQPELCFPHSSATCRRR
jgi:MFS family permease